METTALDFLILIAFGLLVFVTGGIVYLNAVEWRDRRRQDREKRSEKRSAKRR